MHLAAELRDLEIRILDSCRAGFARFRNFPCHRLRKKATGRHVTPRPSKKLAADITMSVLRASNILCVPSHLLARAYCVGFRMCPGKNSGKDIDKALRSGEEGFVWEELPSEVLGAPRTVAIVPGCTAYMNLQLVRKQVI